MRMEVSECADNPSGLVQNPPTDIMQTYTEIYEYPEKFGRGGYVDSSLHPPWICVPGNSIVGGTVRYRTMPIHLYPKIMNCRQTEDVDCLSHVVCYDCVCLMPLMRMTMLLFSDIDILPHRHITPYDIE